MSEERIPCPCYCHTSPEPDIREDSYLCEECDGSGFNPPQGNVECRTCNDFRQVFASRDVERPELDRWYACPDCTTQENVDSP